MRFFGHHLLACDVVTVSQLLEALDEQRRLTPLIGRVARNAGKLSTEQVLHVLNHQNETGRRFLKTAVTLGYLVERNISPLLAQQRDARPRIGELIIELGFADSGRVMRELQQFLGASEDKEPS